MSDRVEVCQLDELSVGEGRRIQVNGKRVGVFRLADEVVAYLDYCPHEGAPVCAGQTVALVEGDKPSEPLRMSRPGEILMCPWHGWEFDLANGSCLTDRCRLLKYQTEVVDGVVYVVPRKR